MRRAIWTRALGATQHAADARLMSFVLPAVAEVFDAAAAPDAALRIHVPPAVFMRARMT
jgi:hypothetical protein